MSDFDVTFTLDRSFEVRAEFSRGFEAVLSMEGGYTVGETVHIRVRVALPGSKTPFTPDEVQLLSVELGETDVLGGTQDFTEDLPGDFSYDLATAGFDPGTYTVSVRCHSAAPERTVLLTDTFVLFGS